MEDEVENEDEEGSTEDNCFIELYFQPKNQSSNNIFKLKLLLEVL